MQWFDGAGVSISTVNGTNATAATTWGRHSQVFTAPVGAAFAMPILAWSGTALVGQALDFAQIWMNEGAVASGPVEVEIVGDLCVFPVITLFGTLTARSEERRVGKEGVSTYSSRWSPDHKKK